MQQVDRQLPAHLEASRRVIAEHAREAGLEPFETIFTVLDYRQMNQVAAYGGFPTRYPHWRFGMDYDRLSKSYTFGMHRIYEMVINNDPCHAYLLDSNSDSCVATSAESPPGPSAERHFVVRPGYNFDDRCQQ